MTTLGDGRVKSAQCEMCEHCSYICDYCRKPCCTPCSEYDPDCEEDTEFPKGSDGGVRNHPGCIINAKKQTSAGFGSRKKEKLNIFNKRNFGVIHSPNPSPIKKKIKSNTKNPTRRNNHQGTGLGGKQCSAENRRSEEVCSNGPDKNNISSYKVLTEKDKGTSHGQNQTDEKFCLFCNASVKTYIPHLKKNSNCINFYFNKFELTLGSYEEKLEKLKERLKVSEQAKRRERKDRKEEGINRRKHNQDSVNCLDSFKNMVETIMSTVCTICDSHVSPKYSIKTDRNHPLHEEYGNIFICKWCDRIQKNITATWSSIKNVTTAKWVKENVTLRKRISSLKEPLTSTKVPSNVGHLTYTKNNKLSMVLYPIHDKECCKNVDPPLNEQTAINDPTILIADEIFPENPIQTVSRDLAELAARSSYRNIERLFSILYMDRHKLISSYDNRRNNRNQLSKEGKFFEGKLILNDVTSMKGCLSQVRGSNDFWEQNIRDLQFSQLQNGTTNIQICWTVYPGRGGIVSDKLLALCILRVNGYQFASTVQRGLLKDSREYRLCCEIGCDPFKCMRQTYHPDPLEVFNSYKGEVGALTVSRYVSEKVNAFINKCVRPNSKQFSLFLAFNRPTKDSGDSSIQLCGHIWTEQLSNYDITETTLLKEAAMIPDVFKEETLKEVFGDHGGCIKVVHDLVSWPKYKYEAGGVTPETLQHIQISEHQSLRETSIWEFILSSARNFELKWRSQAVVYVNTGDPLKIKLEKADSGFRKENEDLEMYFYHELTKTWWQESNSNIKDYKGRPSLLNALLLLQMVIHYKELSTSNKNYETKLEELKKSGGTQSSVNRIIPLVTDRDKFPSAPEHLPEFILINGKKILQLKSKENIAVFQKPSEPLSIIILCCPWNSPDEIEKIKESSKSLEDAISRRNVILPNNSFDIVNTSFDV